MEREVEIRLIAYSLWVREGFPHGRAVEHWLRAEAIWEKDHEGKNAVGFASAIPEEEAEDEDISYAASF
jgi:hypothetical protein